jgi:hypothetical protein
MKLSANPLALYPWARSRAEAMAYARSPFDYDRLSPANFNSRPRIPDAWRRKAIAAEREREAGGYWPQHGAIIRGSNESAAQAERIWNMQQSLQAQDELRKTEAALQTPHLGPTEHPYPWTEQQAEDVYTPRRASPDSDLCVCGRDFIACIIATPRWPPREVGSRLQRAINAAMGYDADTALQRAIKANYPPERRP